MWTDIIKDKEEYWMTRQEYEEKGIYVLEKLGIKVGGKVRQENSSDNKYAFMLAHIVRFFCKTEVYDCGWRKEYAVEIMWMTTTG